MAGLAEQADVTAAMLAKTPGWLRICALREDVDDALASTILAAAARLAETDIAPLDKASDRTGCTLTDGRVKTPEGFVSGWRALAGGGWLAIDLPASIGGQELPLALHTACQTLFDRACPALVMAAGATRAGAWLLHRHAPPSVRQEWAPKLATGDWTATICISEAEAGSDVGRIRTTATKTNDGWLISGQKMWISFADHNVAERIGHLVLARTAAPETGTRGLSLFLMPSTVPGEAGEWKRNAVAVERIEEKLGLHGSPTCVLRMDRAQAILIGDENAGIGTIFAMIELMRLLTAGQGLGIASAACDIATAYAHERRQGGSSNMPAVPISDHADVRRQIASLRGRTEALRAFILELATIMDLARLETDAAKREEMEALAAWLLPIAKNFGAELGFDVAHGAIQVLGAAGYTREWPLEQYLRDARIFSIFEGTTGMQALDLLHRRLWKENGAGLHSMVSRIEDELEAGSAWEEEALQVRGILGKYMELSEEFRRLRADPRQAEAGAEAFLRASWAIVSAWMSLRLCSIGTPMLAAAARYRLAEASIELEQACLRARIPASLSDAFLAG